MDIDSGARRAAVRRTTRESDISVELALDGQGRGEVETGIPFFDHMLSQLGRHGGFDLDVQAKGDLEVDTHHTVEDTGLCLGQALREALGDKAGIRRFASISLPLDEALIDVALDLSGRPFIHYEVDFGAEPAPLGSPGFDPQLAEEFLRAFAVESALTLHVTARYGRNTHHLLEATFKGVARALREAVRVEGRAIPSTKGVL
jgi:imidazoleglycerol-phosphate dehydratase